jgi:hypothetical protein
MRVWAFLLVLESAAIIICSMAYVIGYQIAIPAAKSLRPPATLARATRDGGFRQVEATR